MAAMIPNTTPLAAPGKVNQIASQAKADAVMIHTAQGCPPTKANNAISQKRFPNS